MAEARAGEAVAGRARRRRLRHQADEAMSFVAVLFDLAERGTPVALHTHAGTVHHGRLVTVGRDFVALDARGATVLVAAEAIAAVGGAGAGAGAADRGPGGGALLVEALAELMAGGRRVRIVARGGAAFSGEVRAVGDDVVALVIDGESAEVVYLPLASVSEVSFFGSG